MTSSHNPPRPPARIALFAPATSRREIEGALRLVQGIELITAPSPADLVPLIGEIDALVAPVYAFTPEVTQAVCAAGPRLRLLQLLTAGYDRLAQAPLPPGLVVATAGASLAPAVADHALALILAQYRGIPASVAAQGRMDWDRTPYEQGRSLSGQAALIYGFGAIGKAIARRLAAFDVQITGVNRRGFVHPLAHRMLASADLDTGLPLADIVVIAADLNAETRHAFDARRLGLMRRGALLVNVSRGQIVQTDALVAALDQGTIGGAALDVTDPEPLPPDHPLWRCPNTLISAHVAGGGAAPMLASHAADNIARFIRGDALDSVVALPAPASGR